MKTNEQYSFRIGANRLGLLALLFAGVGPVNADIAAGNSPGQLAAQAAVSSYCTSTITTPDQSASFACNIGTLGASFLPNLQLSPQAAMQAETVAITSPYQFIRKITQQAQKLRDCLTNDGQQKPGCKSSGGDGDTGVFGSIGPFGLSFSGGGGFGDQNTTDVQTGFKIDTRQANLMIDYAFSQNLTGGFAFNYVNAARTLGLASGSLNSDSYRFAPFLSYSPTQDSYITLLGGYARVEFDSIRKVSPFFGSNLSDATANYGANEFFASLGAGYTYRLNGLSLRGYGRGDLNHIGIGGFQESGGVDAKDNNAYTSAINGRDILSVTSTLGAELSYAISTPLIPVIIPKLHAEWVHEFANNNQRVQTTFLVNGVSNSISQSQLPIAVSDAKQNWANLGVGLQMQFRHAIVGYLNYDTLFIQNASNQTVSGGIRVNF